MSKRQEEYENFNPEQIVILVMKDMQGIGGIPSDQEFFDEFVLRFSAALGVNPTIGLLSDCIDQNEKS